MDFFEVIQNRVSVRGYQSREVEPEKLQQVLSAANWAPTAANRQPFRLIVCHTAGREAEFKQLYAREWFTQAPIIIVACAVTSEAWARMDGKNYSEVDTTIALDHLILAAAALGLGTCWIAAFNPTVAREIFQLPPEVEPVALTPLGYPTDTGRPRKRKALAELLKNEHW